MIATARSNSVNRMSCYAALPKKCLRPFPPHMGSVYWPRDVHPDSK